jgi:hypothetical protein
MKRRSSKHVSDPFEVKWILELGGRFSSENRARKAERVAHKAALLHGLASMAPLRH